MKKSLFHDIMAMILYYRRTVALAFAMVLISNILLVANPLLFRQAVLALDLSTTPSAYTKTSYLFQSLFGSHYHALWPWITLLLSVIFVASFFKYYMRLLFISVSREVERKVRFNLFERIQEQSRLFFDRHVVGELISRLTNDISVYRDVLGPGVMYPIYFGTLVVPAMFALFYISVPLAALSLLPILMLPFLVLIMQNSIFQTSLKVQEALAEVSTITQEHYSGIRIVKSYNIESESLKRFKTFSTRLMRLNLRLACMQGMFYPFLTFVTRSVTVFLVMLTGYIIVKAWGELSAADFLAFMWIQSYIYFPVMMLGWVLPLYQRGSAAYQRLLEIYQEPIQIKDNPHSTFTLPPKANIVLNDLSYTYAGNETPTLSRINLKIKGGSFVGITGPIGSGKTTLFRLLNREYEIPHGMIVIGDRDIHDYSLKALREEIVTVEQSPFLFSKSIAENVRFGSDEASQKDIELASQQSDLHTTIMSFPERYDTIVGERGMTLSGGQKQRVSLARAFLVDRSIYLLDDVFSAVDFSTEKRIFEQMKTKFRDKTVLLITPRVSILEQLDRVIYLINGKVVEDGTPEALMKKNGHFAALVELQKIQDLH